MTCQEANFLGDIRDLRLDVYSVQEKRILCWEKISEYEKPWGEVLDLRTSRVYTKGCRGYGVEY